MKPASRKLLWYAALLCSALFALLCWRRYGALPETPFRYEVRAQSQIWRLSPGKDVLIEDARLYAVQPPSELCRAWSPLLPSEKGEVEGVALFKGSGALYAFLPRSDTAEITSISASPQGRVLALVMERAGFVEFIAVPELKSLGRIGAVGPILWKDSVSGSTFTPDRKTISFSMAPEAGDIH